VAEKATRIGFVSSGGVTSKKVELEQGGASGLKIQVRTE
jgi:hypothetical protein